MRQVIYALQFKGAAVPVSESPMVMKATTSASSSTITTTVGENGVEASIQPSAGGSATFESQVRMTGESSFDENGTISFGGNNRLQFSTIGEGRLGPSPDPKLSTGAVLWKIDSGEGRFSGASGYITSNFSVSDQGAVTDNQVGVIFLQ
jgi:hypothetical protein